jgi:hypothetical protein
LARALMGLMKDRHGTWYARVKVPERLQAAVARVLGGKRRTQVFLKKSLGTKDLKAANVRGKLVLAEFDRTLSEAAALLKPVAVATRQSLNATEIARMAEYVFAKQLAWDERFRVGGREELKRLEVEVRQQLAEGEELQPWAFPYEHNTACPWINCGSAACTTERACRCCARRSPWATSRQSRRT